MSLKLIPCAAAYKIVLPGIDAMIEHLSTVKFEELQPTMAYGSGFVNVEPQGELVVEFPGGYAFALRYDEKIIPGSVINAELKKWAADFEAIEGYKPGRKLMREQREHVAVALCTKALTRTKVVNCFYNPAEQLLIVPSIGTKMRDIITKQLVRAVGSIKSTTINVSSAKANLTTRLLAYLGDDAEFPFNDFGVGGRVTMNGPAGKSAFDIGSLDNATQGLNEAVASGAQVAEIALELNGVTFRLTQDFLLKGVKFADGSMDFDPPDPDGFAAEEVFKHEAGVQVLLVSKAINGLCEMFDYKPEVPADDPTADDLV